MAEKKKKAPKLKVPKPKSYMRGEKSTASNTKMISKKLKRPK